AMITARKRTATMMYARRSIRTIRNLELEVEERVERLREHYQQRSAEQRMYEDRLRPGDLPAPLMPLGRPGDDHGPKDHDQERSLRIEQRRQEQPPGAGSTLPDHGAQVVQGLMQIRRAKQDP